MASLADASRHIFINERRFRELLDAGVIARADRRGYDLDEVRRSYIENLRETAAGRAPTGGLDPSQERARKDCALADKIEMENDLMRGNVVPVESVIALVTREYALVRDKMLAIPVRVAGRMPANIRDAAASILAEEVRQALENLSDPQTVAARAGRTDNPKEI